MASDLPGNRFHIQARRSSKLRRLGAAMTTLAGCLNRQIEVPQGNPGGRCKGGAVVAGRHVQRRIRPLAGRGFPAPGHCPLGARDLQARVIVKGGEREEVKIPGDRRPVGQFALEALLQKRFEAGGFERPAFQAGGGLRWGNRLRMKPGAPD